MPDKYCHFVDPTNTNYLMDTVDGNENDMTFAADTPGDWTTDVVAADACQANTGGFTAGCLGYNAATAVTTATVMGWQFLASDQTVYEADASLTVWTMSGPASIADNVEHTFTILGAHALMATVAVVASSAILF